MKSLKYFIHLIEKKGRIIFEITSFPKTKQKFYSFQNCNSQKELILLNYL